MDAKVKADYRFGEVTAFAGFNYVKTEWRPVPAGHEAEAEKHPHLDTQAPSLAEPAAVATPDLAPSDISTEIPELEAEQPVEVVEGPSAEAEAERSAFTRASRKGSRK